MLSPTFSSNTGFPYCTAASSRLMNYRSLNFRICSLSFFSRFLSHLFAWPCGSMLSVHLCDLWIIIPFSTENESPGRPAMVQALTATGSPNIPASSNFPGDAGISIYLIRSLHSWAMAALSLLPKKPRYAMSPAAVSTSPTNNSYLAASSLLFYSHLVFSPPNPLISFLALSSLTLHSYISCCNLS